MGRHSTGWCGRATEDQAVAPLIGSLAFESHKGTINVCLIFTRHRVRLSHSLLSVWTDGWTGEQTAGAGTFRLLKDPKEHRWVSMGTVVFLWFF